MRSRVAWGMFRPGTSLSTTETVAGFKPKCCASFFKLVGLLLDAAMALELVAVPAESPGATVVETSEFSPFGMLAQMRAVHQEGHHCKVVTESSSKGRSRT